MSTATPTTRLRGTRLNSRSSKTSVRGDCRKLLKASTKVLRLRGTNVRSRRG